MTILQDVKAAAAAEAGKEPAVEKKDEAAPPAEGAADELSAAEYRSLALARGWVPKKAFKGDPERWVDEKTFYERSENELPLVKARNRKLEKEVADLHDLMKKVVASNKDQQDRAVEQALAKLKDEKKEAVKEGDVDKVEAIDKKIDKVKADAAKEDDEPKAPAKGKVPEEFTDWVGKNKWFKESARMRKYAEGVWDELKEDEDFVELPLADQLKRIGKEVRAQFPDKFAPKPKEPNAVEGGGGGGNGGGGGSGKKTWADLPADVRAIADDLVSKKVVTREKYLADYRW